jgi:hypothetical protein
VLAVYTSWFDPVFLGMHRLIHQQRLFRASIPAGNPKNVYLADWRLAGSGDLPRSPEVLRALGGATLLTEVDTADLQSEHAAGYRLHVLDGAYENLLQRLRAPDGSEVVDGGRLVSGSERFVIEGALPGRDLILVARTHAPFRLRVEINGAAAGTWTEGGEVEGWRETAYLLPGNRIDGDRIEVRLASDDPHHSAYGSFHYWVYRR